MAATKQSKKKRRAQKRAVARATLRVPATPETTPEARRILVVDDEPRISSFLARALTSCGYATDTARDGETAIALIAKRSYDLVLLDLLLPLVDGFAVLQQIQEIRPNQDVIVLSALSDVETKVRCFELGACDYVPKPFVLAELVARVRLRVRVSRTLDATRVLRHGRIALDLQRHHAIVDGVTVYLSAREFGLLEYLVRRAGEVCTRQDLLRAVWGISFETGTNVVDAYVHRLRTKLGSDAIETIRGVGYCCGAGA